jgi:Zn-dependent M28 family amino/carboxypeptidase
VIGFFPGEKTEDTIVLSAHYDHLGDDPNGYRFPGAIDNVSGVVTLLEIARLLANRSTKLPFNIVIAFFSGEESGLQGAYQFLKSFSKPIMAAINFDCLGQEDEVRLARIGYAEPSHWLPRVGKKVMESYGIEIKWKDYDGEDSVAFRKRDIPALGLGQKTDTTGVSIHTPDDEIDSLSLVALETWSKLAFNIIEEISSLKPYL